MYLQYFEEKLGGLFYEPTYELYSGECPSLYGMVDLHIKGSYDKFTI